MKIEKTVSEQKLREQDLKSELARLKLDLEVEVCENVANLWNADRGGCYHVSEILDKFSTIQAISLEELWETIEEFGFEEF